jgi:hypothetical protein
MYKPHFLLAIGPAFLLAPAAGAPRQNFDEWRAAATGTD